MSGVWVFKDGVFSHEEDPRRRANDGTIVGGSLRRKVLEHLPSGEIVSSYDFLEHILTELGWERYTEGGNPQLIQFHKPPTVDLISLPKDFAKFNSIHMYDIVVKTRNIFHVRDL